MLGSARLSTVVVRRVRSCLVVGNGGRLGMCPRSGDKQVPSQSERTIPTGESETPCDGEGAETVVASVLGRKVGRLRCKLGPI